MDFGGAGRESGEEEGGEARGKGSSAVAGEPRREKGKKQRRASEVWKRWKAE